ncbi:MAG TPA: NADH-quinone oxidoreductase subunit L [Thermoanaerobaculia bacterium]|nr:NADH-quinone oxidoreductase subunit L [Thermoanaerobaculia bacterium]
MGDISAVLWLVPAFPLLGALINGFRSLEQPFARKSRRITRLVALGSTLMSALVATFYVVIPYVRHAREPFEVVYYTWIPAGIGQVAGGFISDFRIDLGFQVDPLSATMMMVVTWVGFLIHVYATGYMSHESGYTRFFCYFNLFMFMMLLLVMGNNYVVMFVGWEGVGLCSYLLIGFYYDKTFAADAGKKAFIVNRIGDFGFILALFLIFTWFGTSDFSTVFSLAASDPQRVEGVATAICLLLFVGACGKSAQIPLYVWLPDAMAGPTPVSALIHAATMVTAGVYMVVRSNVLFRLSPTAMLVVAIVGALTALFAATIGTAQNDIKKVLAYSTVSQLGFMFLAVGVGAFTAAIFHLMTHAFFKACLFLGAGSVIHGCNGEQDMRKMGGLRKYMPVTHWTFLVATVAIAGIPPLAGFFSKDEILVGTFVKRFPSLGAPWSGMPVLLWIMAMIAATFTAFYMFRAYYMTFWGTYRGAAEVGHRATEPEHKGHELIDDTTRLHPTHEPKVIDEQVVHGHAREPHESPRSMTGVLAALAVLSIIGGWVGPPFAAFGIHHPNPFQSWLAPVLWPIAGEAFEFPHASLFVDWLLILLSIGAAVAGIMVARRFYTDPSFSRPRRFVERFPAVHRLVENKYYVDEIYQASFIRGTILSASALAWFDVHVIDGLVNAVRHISVIVLGGGSWLFDRFIIDGAVNGVGWSAQRSSTLLRRAQSGLIQNYALIMSGGVVLLIVIYLLGKP